MTVFQLKKRVTIHLVLYMLLSLILMISLACILIYRKAVHNKNQGVIDNIYYIKSQIIKIREETDKKESLLNKYLDLWRRVSYLNDKNLEFELNRLYKKYCILNPEVYMTVPEDVEISCISQYTKKCTKVVKRKVTLSFSTVSDKHIFLFLKSVPSLPGYVMIQSLVLIKEKELDTVVIDQILNGDMIETVRANIVFDWYTILRNG